MLRETIQVPSYVVLQAIETNDNNKDVTQIFLFTS